MRIHNDCVSFTPYSRNRRLPFSATKSEMLRLRPGRFTVLVSFIGLQFVRSYFLTGGTPISPQRFKT